MANFEYKILYVTCPKGLSQALKQELEDLKIKPLKEEVGGVQIERTLENVYKVCLWSRVANRVLWGISTFDAPDPAKLYGGIKQIQWSKFFSKEVTIAIDFFSKNSGITHSQFGAQKVKDAICDQFVSVEGSRPNVDLKNPDIRVNVHLVNDKAHVSLDMSGESLHARGYRTQAGEAPLKENLAAGILRYMGWHDDFRTSSFLDPMCGSGTLVIEAAMIALDMAPGLTRKKFGFHCWKDFDQDKWKAALDQAQESVDKAKRRLTQSHRFFGYDHDERVLMIAKDNAKRAGVDAWVQFERKSFDKCKPPESILEKGTVILNPPYGTRLKSDEDLSPLYKLIGDTFKQKFANWNAGVFAPYGELIKKIGLKPKRRIEMWNGPIECRLLRYELYASLVL